MIGVGKHVYCSDCNYNRYYFVRSSVYLFVYRYQKMEKKSEKHELIGMKKDVSGKPGTSFLAILTPVISGSYICSIRCLFSFKKNIMQALFMSYSLFRMLSSKTADLSPYSLIICLSPQAQRESKMPFRLHPYSLSSYSTLGGT